MPMPADIDPSEHEWLTAKEAAQILRVHPNTIYARVNDRSRSDALPSELIDKGRGRIRIHRSAVYPEAVPLRSGSRLPGRRPPPLDDRIQRLLHVIRQLRADRLEQSNLIARLTAERDAYADLLLAYGIEPPHEA
jgi:helix-turn-helix protein